MSTPLVLVLGGTRSGKSRFAQARAAEMAGDRPVTYIATAWRGDAELDDRIRGHQRARPADWPVVEVHTDLAGAIADIEDAEVVLLDGLTLWLAGAFDPSTTTVEAFLDGPFAAALEAVARRDGPTIVVSDEINLGVMPVEPATRAFIDLMGHAHQRMAGVADEVYFMVAGLPMAVKGS